MQNIFLIIVCNFCKFVLHFKLKLIGEKMGINDPNSKLNQDFVATDVRIVNSDGTASPGGVYGLVAVDTLAGVSVARQLTAGASSANTALTASCRRISMFARNADIRYEIGTGAQTANGSTSHWIGQGERLDLDVPASANIAVIRAASTDGVLELSELTL